MILIWVRSFIFHIFFWSFFALCLIGALWVFIFPNAKATHVMKFWARGSVLLLRICGTKLEVRGLNHIPIMPTGYLIASKHQSIFETIALLMYFPKPIFILKQQLINIPVFGAYLKKFGMIAVDRDGGGAALKNLTTRAKAALSKGHQIIIFPEGTRTKPYAAPEYKSGIVHLYRQLECVIVPVALNSGKFWGRRAFRIYPGTIIIEFLPVIPIGIAKTDILPLIQNIIEPASLALLPHIISSPLAEELSNEGETEGGKKETPYPFQQGERG